MGRNYGIHKITGMIFFFEFRSVFNKQNVHLHFMLIMLILHSANLDRLSTQNLGCTLYHILYLHFRFYIMWCSCLAYRPEETNDCFKYFLKMESLWCFMFSSSYLFIQCALFIPLLIKKNVTAKNYIILK